MSFIVGLTGGIGSGKSTVAELFVQRGAALIDTDAIAHQLTAPNGAAMAAIAAMLRRRTISSALIAAVAGVGAVLYYELNVGALIGSGVLILTLLARSRRDRPAALRITLLTTIAAAAPAGALLLGRFVTGGQASTYAGTTTRVGGEAARTFVEGMLSSLPGAAWKLSDRFVTGGRSPGWWGFVCAVVTIAALTVSHRLDPMGPSEPEGPEPFDAVLAPPA